MTTASSANLKPDAGLLDAMPWITYLREFRHRAVISMGAVLAGTVISFTFHPAILRALTQPYCQLPSHFRLLQGRCTLIVTGVLDAFKLTLTLSLYAGVVLSSPVWLYQAWRFITPALHRHERRYALTFAGLSVGLFCAGCAFAYSTMSRGLEFLLGFATGGVAPLLSFNSYLAFITAMVLVFGVSFELPLLIIMLNLAGVLPAVRLRRWSRYIVFGIVVFAAGATPSQDPFTMLALVLPLCVLFGLAWGVAAMHDRRAARQRMFGGLGAVADIPSSDPGHPPSP